MSCVSVEKDQDNQWSSNSDDSSDSSSSESLKGPKPTNPAWQFTVVTAAFTMGSVFAPYTMSAGGWTWGTLIWIYSYLTTWWSGILIGKTVMHGVAIGERWTYPEMMEKVFGRAGYHFTVFFQIMTYYLVNVTLLVNCADWFLLAQEVTHAQGWVDRSTTTLCLYQYVFVAGAIAVVLAQIPTFRSLASLAVISLLSTIARQGILLYQVASYDLLSGCGPKFGGVTSRSAFDSLACTAFLFGGHGLFPEEMREMRRPKSFFPALNVAYVIIGVVYFVGAYVGYAVWGQWTAGDNQFNWPLNGATFASALLSVAWGLIEMATSHVMMLSLVEDLIGLKRTASLHNRLCRVALRASVAASEAFLAFMFSAAGIANIQGVVGAFGFTALTYYGPFAVYWKMSMRRQGAPLWKHAAFLVAGASGIVLTVVGVYSSLAGMAEQIHTYSLFDTARCSVRDVVNLQSCSNPCLEAYGFNTSTCVN